MALIKCKECQKEISDKAKVCIHCGCPIEEIELKEKLENKKKFNDLSKEQKQYVYLEYLKNQKEFTMAFSFGMLALIILLIFILPPALFIFVDICLFVVLMQNVKYNAVKYYEKNVVDFDKMIIKSPIEKKKSKNKLVWKIILGISIFMCAFTTLGTIFSGDIIMTPIVLDIISIIMIIVSISQIRKNNC